MRREVAGTCQITPRLPLHEMRRLTLYEGTVRLLKRREMTCFLGQTTMLLRDAAGALREARSMNSSHVLIT